MSLTGEYVPSTQAWVRDQVETYERTGGREGNTLFDTGMPIIVVTNRGKRTGAIRKTPLMRVEHDGEYALVGSQGGSPKDPVWVHNLRADPTAVMIQDGPEPWDAEVREVTGEERDLWWERAVAAYPPYADYQAATERTIPVFVARRRG
jgi:F420H(2)-dependent quinone reductase